MRCTLQTYVDAVASALANGAYVEAWRSTYGYPALYVLNGEAPFRQGVDDLPLPALVVMPGAWSGGQRAVALDSDVLVECRLREAEGNVPASMSGTTVLYRAYTGHRQLVALVDAVLQDITAGFNGQDAKYSPAVNVDFDNSQSPILIADVTISLTEQTTMPNT